MASGWSLGQVFGLEPPPRAVTLRSRTFRSISAAAVAHGLAANVVQDRLTRGWSVPEAFGLAPHARPRYRQQWRDYLVVSPQGARLRVRDLRRFTRAQNLEQGVLRLLAANPSLRWQGWSCRRASAEDDSVPLWQGDKPTRADPKESPVRMNGA
jgi:hypothetical protein